MKNIYLDNAASTPIDRRVIKTMERAFHLYANPSSFNEKGREAKRELNKARLNIARFLSARADEIIFTGSGSEANSQAMAGLNLKSGEEVLTTPIEHLSVLESLNKLKKFGVKIIFVRVDTEGSVDLKDIKNKLNKNTALVSIMYANNEIGTIQPISAIAKIINNFRDRKVKIYERIPPFFHVDACQAAGYLRMNVNDLGVDLMTFNGAKIYGPKGIGVLYKRRGVSAQPIIYGGDQEHGLRAGTENLSAIVGLAKAVSLIDRKEGRRLSVLRDYFFKRIIKIIQNIKINGPLVLNRLPNNINISILDLTSETLLLELDKYGIYAGSGSACTSHSVEPSHVLKAIGVKKKYLEGALRFSMGRQTTKKDIDYVLKMLPKIRKSLCERYLKD